MTYRVTVTYLDLNHVNEPGQVIYMEVPDQFDEEAVGTDVAHAIMVHRDGLK